MKKTLAVFTVLLVAVAAVGFTQGGFLDSSLYIPSPHALIFGRGASGDVKVSKSADNVLNVGTAADSLTVNSVIVPQEIQATYSSDDTLAATDRVFFVANAAYQVTGCVQLHSAAAGGASKLQVVKDSGTNAPGAGTDILTNNSNTGFDLNATANTLQTGTLSATATDLQLAAGGRLAVDYANAAQSSAGVTVTCYLKRI